jgi:hypothetical protein
MFFTPPGGCKKRSADGKRRVHDGACFEVKLDIDKGTIRVTELERMVAESVDVAKTVRNHASAICAVV